MIPSIAEEKKEGVGVGGEMGESEQRNGTKILNYHSCFCLSSVFAAIRFMTAKQFGDRTFNRLIGVHGFYLPLPSTEERYEI